MKKKLLLACFILSAVIAIPILANTAYGVQTQQADTYSQCTGNCDTCTLDCPKRKSNACDTDCATALADGNCGKGDCGKGDCDKAGCGKDGKSGNGGCGGGGCGKGNGDKK